MFFNTDPITLLSWYQCEGAFDILLMRPKCESLLLSSDVSVSACCQRRWMSKTHGWKVATVMIKEAREGLTDRH